MKLFTSDTHFFHESIIRFCNRPYEDPDMMNVGMAHIWNQHVSKEDTVYHLGDYAFKAYSKKDEIRDLTSQLNGSIVLILGNHDHKDIIPYYGINLFNEKVYMTMGGVNFKLTHYPYRESMTEHDKEKRQECFTNLELDRSTKKPYPLICGHVHNSYRLAQNIINVGWDAWHRPISEIEIMNIYNDTNGFTKNLERYNEAL